MSYRIKTVAALTGINPTTLRAWERRYDVVVPRRTDSGYRVYSESDIAMLSQIKTLVDRGLKAGEAIDLVRRGVAQLAPADLPPSSLSSVRDDLLAALLELNRAEAVEVYAALAAVPLDRQMDEVLTPLLRQVGELWERGQCSIAQEHFCSAFAREKLVCMLQSLTSSLPAGPEVICVGAPGERHEFGLMIAAVHLALRGWQVTYLGADVPVEEVERLVARRRPALLCTSVLTPLSRSDSLRFARALRTAAPPETTVVVGGSGLARGLPRSPTDGLYLLRDVAELEVLELH
jgi:DNA-binding transcriptional MerR regulator